ncbi:alpha-L-rhamnosidase C-terminal domain-containing protein [Plebeiibacterium marinum]|uniref:Alpha-L-rhamnosidase N-terminal domain-containing protein n=1 Tax=Plebeiibacterium marinum TaxID=2992111 RepID=A0AAE3MBF4_9BACT|nr:alpha-L-rhamnosidase C-terminal domain-containing protein [Plebeiobacterium marinum]MCW3804514.1 alpha-L-rhamnosidase N-terminal domain-containing protein [Plebeiobacterium marinum]
MRKHINKMMGRKVFFCLFVVMLTGVSQAQEVSDKILQKNWRARWITVPESNPNGYGIYYFRKSFELSELPESFPVHVSADNRYKLYVNEKLVSMGPARGDLLHWNFETIDLIPYLQKGNNIIAVQVWNEGEDRPLANISAQTAFVINGGNSEAIKVKSDKSWKCIFDDAYSPIPVKMNTAFFAGPGEFVDMHKTVNGWNKLSFDDSTWAAAEELSNGMPKNKIGYGRPNSWMLVPSSLPQMELSYQRLKAVRKSEGVKVPAVFPKEKAQFTIPANTQCSIILDQEELTNAYLTLNFSKGNNSAVSIDYAESLFTKYPHKGNRNEIEGKMFLGKKDSIISNGADGQEFTTLAFRTYRYIQLKVQTQDEPLIINDIYGTYTAYPFQLKAKLDTDNKELKQIFDIGWRTARLCAYETYMDCPYYELLQYIGDTRIQAMVSLYNSGDDRLVKNFINQIDYSRQPEGITMSRYPSSMPQYITPFSLWYIGSVYDYMMYGSDLDFVKGKLSGIRQILEYFEQFQQEDGRVKDLPWWNFTDWVNVKGWSLGARKAGKDGCSALIDLQLLMAYQAAADLEKELGLKELATIYTQKVDQLKESIKEQYWDETKQLYADESRKKLFSQHANAMAILTGVATKEESVHLGKQLLTDSTLAPASIYFKYYLHQALTKAGYGDQYTEWLDIWRENIKLGLTTWAEDSGVERARSDCHAWGASPNIEFFRTILGIDSDAPGFSKVKIEPHLGDIKEIGGEMPHPNGIIKVHYSKGRDKLKTVISLPENTTGRLIWHGKEYNLKEGENSLVVK